MKNRLGLASALILLGTILAMSHRRLPLSSNPGTTGASLLEAVTARKPDLAPKAFAGLMTRAGVSPVPYFDGLYETIPLRFSNPSGDVAVLVMGCRAGGGGVYIFDRSGKLLMPPEEGSSISNGRAVDLNGDGFDELIYDTLGGGTGLFVQADHILTNQGGRPRELLSIVTEYSDCNYCGTDFFDTHNEHAEADVRFDPPQPDGSVVVTVDERRFTDCDCPPELKTRKKPVPPDERRTDRYVWREGADTFEPLP